jgi:hypothetical protein
LQSLEPLMLARKILTNNDLVDGDGEDQKIRDATVA